MNEEVKYIPLGLLGGILSFDLMGTKYFTQELKGIEEASQTLHPFSWCDSWVSIERINFHLCGPWAVAFLLCQSKSCFCWWTYSHPSSLLFHFLEDLWNEKYLPGITRERCSQATNLKQERTPKPTSHWFFKRRRIPAHNKQMRK